MAKIMLFIDGTWLYKANPRLAEAYGQNNFQLDYGKLPQILAEEVTKQLGATDYDVVRTNLFGSYPINCDVRDDDSAERQKEFYSRLKEEYHYEVEIFSINFRGSRLRREDRIYQNDKFEPKEKCVDISLATSMLYFAAIPYAYDIAIAVIGDLDFKPVLQHVRRLGKRVAIASVKGNCAKELADPTNPARVKDFDIIWLDDLLHRLELRYERIQVECESPLHKGTRYFYSEYRLRKGEKVYCQNCRDKFNKQKQELFQQDVREPEYDDVNSGLDYLVGQTLSGIVKPPIKTNDSWYSYIIADEFRYYFNLVTNLQDMSPEDIKENLSVYFEVNRAPQQGGKPGEAINVRKHL